MAKKIPSPPKRTRRSDDEYVHFSVNGIQHRVLRSKCPILGYKDLVQLAGMQLYRSPRVTVARPHPGGGTSAAEVVDETIVVVIEDGMIFAVGDA